MSNSPEMKVFIASAEKYLLSLGKDELNKRINSRKDGDIGKLILEGGFLEGENLFENDSFYQFKDQIEFVSINSIKNNEDGGDRITQYNCVDWISLYLKKATLFNQFQFSEMIDIQYVPNTNDSDLLHCRGSNKYQSEEPESWMKKKIA